LALVNYVAPSVAHFVPFEFCIIYTLRLLGFLTALRHVSLKAVVRMEAVIYVPSEFGWTMKPWAGADEDAFGKPFRTVVSRGGTGIWSNVIVTVGAVRGWTDLDADLGRCIRGGRGDCDADHGNHSQ